jgi:uncharacterized protein YcfJ
MRWQLPVADAASHQETLMRTLATRTLWRALAAIAAVAAAAPALAQITLYERGNSDGRSFTVQSAVVDLRNSGFNDQASSAVVRSNLWEICEDARFRGQCSVLRPGQYASLAAMGLNNRVSSVRAVARNTRVEESHYAPYPAVRGDYRRRHRERLFEAPITSVRAVLGTPEQRCWIEREAVPVERHDARVPGAIFGAVIGGILGHQIGGGSGRDLATAGGAVAGAVVGSNLGRDRNGAATTTRDVQRCNGAPGPATPAYWDVTYQFRGQWHQVQLAEPPGATITVNRQGEPRA